MDKEKEWEETKKKLDETWKKMEEVKEELEKKSENQKYEYISPEEVIASRYNLFDWNTLYSAELPPQEWLIESLIPHPSLTILAGHPGCGKSWLLLEMARSLSTKNKSFLDHFKIYPGKILYVDEENGISEVQRRVRTFETQWYLTYFIIQKGIRLDKEEDREILLDLTRCGKYKLVIFDSLSAVHNLEENSAKEMNKLMDFLKRFRNQGVSILLSHHHRKDSFFRSESPAQALRGSSLILAQTDCLLSVEKKKETLNGFEILIRQEKLRQGKSLKPFLVSLEEEKKGKVKLSFLKELEEEMIKREKAKEIILNSLEEGEKGRPELLNLVLTNGISQRCFDEGLKELREEGKIVSRKEGRIMKYRTIATPLQK